MSDSPVLRGHRAQTECLESLNTRLGSAGPPCVPAQAPNTPHFSTPPRTQTSAVSIGTAGPSVTEHPASGNPTGSLRKRSREIAELDDNTAKGERTGPKRRTLDEPDPCELLFLNTAKEAEEQPLNFQDTRTTLHRKSALEPPVPVTSIFEHGGGPPDRTLRLQSVPATLDEEKLKDYLTNLECSKGPTSTIMGFSLSKDGVSQVATVSFLDIPTALQPCQKGKAIIVSLPPTKNQTLSIEVDCDFLGMTVLYCPENPVYE